MSGEFGSFYVHRRRVSDGREGYVGSLRPRSRADREANAWRDSDWEATVLPNTPEVRQRVRAWQRQVKARRAIR